MNTNLEPAKKVLRDFLNEIESVEALSKNIFHPHPALSFTIQDRNPWFDESEFTSAPDSCLLLMNSLLRLKIG